MLMVAEAAPPLESLAPRETLSRQAYASVRRAIRDGLISPGVFYSEQQIAKALRISRTPVREALIELAREDVVEKLPQRGFRIRPIPEHELMEVFELRALLEMYTVRHLARVATPPQVAVLETILDRQHRAWRDPGEFLEYDEQFHITMAKFLGYRHVKATLLSLRSIMLVAAAAALGRHERAKSILKEHRRVLERIAAHDSVGAVRAIRHHIDTTRREAKVFLDQNHGRAEPNSVRNRTGRTAVVSLGPRAARGKPSRRGT